VFDRFCSQGNPQRVRLRISAARGAPSQPQAIAVGEVRARFAEVHGSAVLSRSAQRVIDGELDPYTAADDLVASLTATA